MKYVPLHVHSCYSILNSIIKPKDLFKRAAELGIKAESIGIKKKATTHKGKKMLDLKAPKLIENPKKCVMIKGSKCSNNIMNLLKEIH